jgi:hypothetical protein
MPDILTTSAEGVKQRMVEVRPGEYAREVVLAPGSATIGGEITDPATLAIQEGRMYTAGKAITITATGPNDRAAFRVQNPSDSGKIVTVLGMDIYSNIAQQIRYRDVSSQNPVGTSTPPKNMNQALTSPPAPKALAYWSDKGSAPGNAWDNESRVDPAAPLKVQFPRGLILGPGKALAVDCAQPGAQVTTVNVYWFEAALSG